jgi:uncharacterized protein (TIGR03790 family)
VSASLPDQSRVDAYLVTTGDRNRHICGAAFQRLIDSPPRRVKPVLGSTFPTGASNVMFYFTGATRVSGIETLRFLPGAIADHVTSWGGIFDQDKPMTALAWIHAGATGSYGTVVEPCSIPANFRIPTFWCEAMHRARRSSKRTGKAWRCRGKAFSSANHWRGRSAANTE